MSSRTLAQASGCFCDSIVQDTGTKGPPKWGGHVGDLLCRYTERRAPRAIGHLLPQRRPLLPGLLRPGAKATDSHWNKRTPSSESCQKSVARQLRPGHTHVHRELTDTSKPLLCLRDVLCRLGRKTVRRIIHGLSGPCNGGVLLHSCVMVSGRTAVCTGGKHLQLLPHGCCDRCSIIQRPTLQHLPVVGCILFLLVGPPGVGAASSIIRTQQVQKGPAGTRKARRRSLCSAFEHTPAAGRLRCGDHLPGGAVHHFADVSSVSHQDI